jgi:RND family efflux transporter MFP subunit
MSTKPEASRITRWLVSVGFVLLAVLVMAWMAGLLHKRMPPGRREASGAPVFTGALAEVRRVTVPRLHMALGTIEARHETQVGSRLLARVERVRVSAGDPVSKGQVLVELDQTDVQARVRQASANLDAGKARLAKAQSDHEKVQMLFKQDAATEREFDDAVQALNVARADVAAGEQALKQAQAQLEYAVVRAQTDGTVIEKQVEEGDMAKPGQTLVTLYDPKRLQLVAPVPARLAVGLAVGDPVGVQIDALGLSCEGNIHEIVPEASSATRSMLVKVTGPCPPGVYSGMFGRMLIPDGQREVLLIPSSAVRRVGQLQMVRVVDSDGGVSQRMVRTGEVTKDGQVEVLSGLRAGERVDAGFGEPHTGKAPTAPASQPTTDP